MANIVNPYDDLYTNLKNKFTVVNNGCEYTVGDYMLSRAGKSKANETALTITANKNNAIASVISFVNEKLTAKTPLKKDRTIRKFPLRTSFSALLSAVAACALILSCGIFTLIGKTNTAPLVAETTVSDQEKTPNESVENFNNAEHR